MKKTWFFSVFLAMSVLTGCGNSNRPQVPMTQQCGYDQSTNENKCIMVPVAQLQQQQIQPQYAQPQYASPPVIVQHSGSSGGDVLAGAAIGMMVGNAMSNGNNSNRYVPPSQQSSTVVNKTVNVYHAAPTAPPPVAALPIPVAPPVAVAPPKPFTIPPVAPKPTVVTSFKPAAPSFTVSRSSSSSSSFRRK
jgi:hypothetical protein